VGWRGLGRGYEKVFIDLLLGMVGSLVCRLVDTQCSSIYSSYEFPFISLSFTALVEAPSKVGYIPMIPYLLQSISPPH
jgi:hypothetical protein